MAAVCSRLLPVHLALRAPGHLQLKNLLQMSGPGGAAPPTAVLSGLWHGGLIQGNSHLFSGSVQPGPRSRAPLRLPSLVAAAKGPRRRSSTARLSLSEPSLLAPGQAVLLDGCSGTRRSTVFPPPPLSKPSTLLPCRNCAPAGSRDPQLQSCSRPAYIHFSQALQPTLRPGPVRRHSHNPALSAEVLHGDLRRRGSPACQGEALSVVGKPCFLGYSHRPAAAAAAAAPAGRAQLHVFMPSEAEAEEGDGESVDEGFMDELDSRIASLKFQQKVPQTLTNNS